MNNYLEQQQQQQVENQECNSGCESGWTVYLDHSSIHSPAYHHHYDYQQQQMGYYLDGATTKGFKNNHEDGGDEDDEDLSMVSDASSGPPHLHDDEYNTNTNTNTSSYDYHHSNMVAFNGKKKQQRGGKVPVQVQDQSFLLDDTASSPFLDGPFSKSSVCNKSRSQPSGAKNVLEYSLGYSTTQFQGRQPYQEHYDFFHPAPPGNQMQQNQLSFLL